MTNCIESIALCLLPCVGVWVAIFRSPLLCHLIEKFSTGEPTLRDDVEMWLIARNRFTLLELYVCTWCQAFWVSVAASILFAADCGRWIAVPAYALTIYPVTCFILWKIQHLDRN